MLIAASKAAWADGTLAELGNAHQLAEATVPTAVTRALCGSIGLPLAQVTNVLSIRFPVPPGSTGRQFAKNLEKQILKRVDPEEMGLHFGAVPGRRLLKAFQWFDRLLLINVITLLLVWWLRKGWRTKPPFFCSPGARPKNLLGQN